MQIALGILIGILLSALVVVVDIWLAVKQTLIKRVESQVEQFTRLQPQILEPPSPQTEALTTIFENNDSINEDTRLDDILG